MVLKFIIALVLTAVISYLLGSCNSAIIVSKVWKKTDIRTVGSKNAGLTNMYRVFGKLPAALTLLGDLGKGIVSVLLSRWIFTLLEVGLPAAANSNVAYETIFVGYIAGFFAIIGHIFPIYYGFKGGKGVLVSCSILLVIDPITFCIVIPFFALIVILTRYVSVASISAAIAYPIITFVSQTLRGMPYVWLNTILVIGTSALLIYMHKPNIIRLKNGTENKFGTKKK
ncbi:MAG: glycerol-3-phosphate 1-O-acyltransferase PlsY [Oscillospiraceae bacterium]